MVRYGLLSLPSPVVSLPVLATWSVMFPCTASGFLAKAVRRGCRSSPVSSPAGEQVTVTPAAPTVCLR